MLALVRQRTCDSRKALVNDEGFVAYLATESVSRNQTGGRRATRGRIRISQRPEGGVRNDLEAGGGGGVGKVVEEGVEIQTLHSSTSLHKLMMLLAASEWHSSSTDSKPLAWQALNASLSTYPALRIFAAPHSTR